MYYEDGDRETLNLKNEKWRPVQVRGGDPCMENSYDAMGYERLQNIAQRLDMIQIEYKSNYTYSVCLGKEDIHSLKDEQWISDGVLDAFLTGL